MALYPALIRQYNAQKRTVRIELVGMSEGDTLLPESELMYSLGDKHTHSEIEITQGDSVWVDFVADDPRYPIVMGYRNPQQGNLIGWRKWHHTNIELAADHQMVLKGKSLSIEFETIETTGKIVNNSSITNKSPVTNQAIVSLNGGINNGNGGAVSCVGGFDVQGDVVANGVSLATHTHGGDSGGSTSSPR